jgi:hypothetical protein
MHDPICQDTGNKWDGSRDARTKEPIARHLTILLRLRLCELRQEFCF